MKAPLVRIKDVSDIDTSKITLYDMNNRYLDPAGNMYALKYDYVTKKVNVVRIIRSLNEDANAITNMIIQTRAAEPAVPSAQTPTAEAAAVAPSEKKDFDPSELFSEIMTLVLTHKERFRGIIMNIKNSYIFTKESKDVTSKLEDIFRNLDIDGIQRIERAESYEKELKQYPRSVSYYQAKMDKIGAAVVEKLSGNNEKVKEFIHYYEMHRTLLFTYTNIKKMFTQLSDLLSRVSSDTVATNNTPFELKSFQDAMTSIGNTMREVDEILNKLFTLDAYLKNLENF